MMVPLSLASEAIDDQIALEQCGHDTHSSFHNQLPEPYNRPRSSSMLLFTELEHSITAAPSCSTTATYNAPQGHVDGPESVPEILTLAG